MKLLAIDPGTRITGYAILNGPNRLQEHGRFMHHETLSAVEKIQLHAADLLELMQEAKPDIVVVEIPSGKVNHARHTGAGAGLSVYGMCAGWLAAVARQHMGSNARFVTELEWTRRKKKTTRAQVIAARFPDYKSEGDPGLNMADAIGLGTWYATELALRQAK